MCCVDKVYFLYKFNVKAFLLIHSWQNVDFAMSGILIIFTGVDINIHSIVVALTHEYF